MARRYIDDDYWPHEDVYLAAHSEGIQRDFIDRKMPGFLLHWKELKRNKLEEGKKSSWDRTCLNWMQRDWENCRHERNDFGSGKLQEDLFEQTLEKVTTRAVQSGELTAEPVPELPGHTRIPHRPSEPPGSGESMSKADALDALAEFSKQQRRARRCR